MRKRKVGVLISGNGTNLQALMDAARGPDYPAEIVMVISNNAEARGVQRARDAGVSVCVISHRDYEDREQFDRAVDAMLKSYGVEFICLAGFMRLLSPWFVDRWKSRILNIHPSLLPDFKGAHAVRDALAAGVNVTGCTVHFVTAEVDDGPIVAQAEVPVAEGDTEEMLHWRIHEAEHKLYPLALAKVCGSIVTI